MPRALISSRGSEKWTAPGFKTCLPLPSMCSRVTVESSCKLLEPCRIHSRSLRKPAAQRILIVGSCCSRPFDNPLPATLTPPLQ